MTKCMLLGVAVERPVMYLCDDISADPLTAFGRVFYQAKTYSEKDTRFLAGMIHLERLPVGTELLLHIDDDETLWPDWQFAPALRQRYLPNMVFACYAILRSIYGRRLTPSELGSDVYAVARRKHKTLVHVMRGSQIPD